ncbi:hypothetical protein RUND412_003953 [Rhizina undulata]
MALKMTALALNYCIRIRAYLKLWRWLEIELTDYNYPSTINSPRVPHEQYIDSIEAVKFDGRRRCLVFKVLWEGENESKATWEDLKTLTLENGEVVAALGAFQQVNPKAEKEAEAYFEMNKNEKKNYTVKRTPTETQTLEPPATRKRGDQFAKPSHQINASEADRGRTKESGRVMNWSVKKGTKDARRLVSKRRG